MMVLSRHRAIGLFLTLALMVASVSVAFAHRPMAAPDGAALAYVLAGGAADDLCGTLGGHGDDGDCMACRLAGGVDLPPRVADAAPVMVLVAGLAGSAVAPLPPVAAIDRTHAPRAPPLA